MKKLWTTLLICFRKGIFILICKKKTWAIKFFAVFAFILFGQTTLVFADAQSGQTGIVGTPEEFGANAFDTLDDTEALQKAIDTYDIVELKDGGTYYISNTLGIESSKKIYTPNERATIVETSGYAAITNTPVLKYKTTENAWFKAGLPTLQIEEGNFSSGDLILLRSNQLWKEDNRGYLRKGEIHLVSTYTDGALTLSEGLFDSYATSEQMTFNVYEPMTISLENIEFTRSAPSHSAMIIIWYTQNSTFKNLKISHAKESGLILQYNYKTTIENSEFNLGVTSDDIQTGYGIQDNGGVYTTISNCTFRSVRRGVDLSGNIPNWNSVVENCYAYGPYSTTQLATGNSGFGTHSTSMNTVFRNNYVQGFKQGFALRGTNTILENNIVEGNQDYFLQATHGTNITVKENTYIRFSQRTQLPVFANLTQSFKGKISLINNISSPLKKWTSKKNNTTSSGNKAL